MPYEVYVWFAQALLDIGYWFGAFFGLVVSLIYSFIAYKIINYII